MINYKKIIVVGGDPNSVNSEIIFKSWKKLKKNIKKKIFIVASYELLKSQFKALNYSFKLRKIKNLNEKISESELKVIDVNLKFKDPFKVNKFNASKYLTKCLNIGHKLSLEKNTLGFINCAISKNLLLKKNTGITEFLAKKCKINNDSEVMFIKGNKFSVSPLTTHLDLKNVSRNIKSKKIIIKVKTIHKNYYKFFNKKPKIGVLGLNPHNAELKSGSEEVNEIIPAINKLKKLGFNINGPFVSDSFFIKDFKNYNVIVGMYHDQVLIPFKSIFKFDAINITLGLKYLRVSPDHGVARNLIKKNKANYKSLLKCIKFINKFGR
tara:strand:- start:1093 stop:2064 length:972 start_codon:yes stop_codon:yes gene_type:complete